MDPDAPRFGPGSLLYETYGDRRGYLLAPMEGLLQLMYPSLGRGVEQHSDFFNEPWERLFRSVPQIQGMIFDGPESLRTAARIRDFHSDIKGTMPAGERYHALDPHTYFWAHATFIDTAWRARDLFARRPYTREEKAAVYAEGVRWWDMYGMSTRIVPATYDDFLDYWNHTVEHVLEPTPSARALIDYFDSAADMPQPWLPTALWRILAPSASEAWRHVLVGTLPPHIRELYGYRWTRANQVAFDTFRHAVARTWPLLPETLRIMPRARTAYHREGRTGLRVALDRAADRRQPLRAAG
ncbi:oxygenase MpaB family protein [Nocardia otitidiscaviarum]|uniref:oxygenase MpaB family protein n=1 Tax=Nocardia otitidiscaviarum TaxID=1823 RepID=UPI0024541A45|nr:oxygenase MpaB family protein [Nocardia otitidiscaviarum]